MPKQGEPSIHFDASKQTPFQPLLTACGGARAAPRRYFRLLIPGPVHGAWLRQALWTGDVLVYGQGFKPCRIEAQPHPLGSIPNPVFHDSHLVTA